MEFIEPIALGSKRGSVRLESFSSQRLVGQGGRHFLQSQIRSFQLLGVGEELGFGELGLAQVLHAAEFVLDGLRRRRQVLDGVQFGLDDQNGRPLLLDFLAPAAFGGR